MPVRCGDGRLSFDSGEACDDGNEVIGDGCGDCQIEVDTVCTYELSDNVTYDDRTAKYTVFPPDSQCTRRRCGDLMINLAGGP